VRLLVPVKLASVAMEVSVSLVEVAVLVASKSCSHQTGRLPLKLDKARVCEEANVYPSSLVLKIVGL
jgi:hypothetical protein